MRDLPFDPNDLMLSRRELLQRGGFGLGAVALSGLFIGMVLGLLALGRNSTQAA